MSELEIKRNWKWHLAMYLRDLSIRLRAENEAMDRAYEARIAARDRYDQEHSCPAAEIAANIVIGFWIAVVMHIVAVEVTTERPPPPLASSKLI